MTEGFNALPNVRTAEPLFSVSVVTNLNDVVSSPKDIVVIDGDTVTESFTDIQRRVMKMRNEDGCEKGIILVFGTRKKLGTVSSEEADVLTHQCGADSFVFDEQPDMLRKKQALAIQMVSERMRKASTVSREEQLGPPDAEKCGCKIWKSRLRASVHGYIIDPPLTIKQFEILEVLIRSRAEVVVYGDLERFTQPTANSKRLTMAITSHIQRMNKRLRPHGVEIRNEPTIGYRLREV